MTKKPEIRKQGTRVVATIIAGAVLVMAPAYLAHLMVDRMKIGVSLTSLLLLSMFVIGIFLLTRVLKD